MLRHWSPFVPNKSTDIRGHEALHHHQQSGIRQRCSLCWHNHDTDTGRNQLNTAAAKKLNRAKPESPEGGGRKKHVVNTQREGVKVGGARGGGGGERQRQTDRERETRERSTFRP